MAIPFRREKLSSQIVKDVSQIIQLEIKDPRMGFVSVTRVELSADLAYARIHVSIMGKAKVKKLTMSALQSARGFVQHLLSRRLAIRQCPEITFERDDSIEKSIKMTQKLDELARERKARESGEKVEAAAENASEEE